MNILNRIDNYLYDKEYKIIIKTNEVNIINYDEIIEFSLEKVSIRYKNKKIIIEGQNLVISKMLDDEVLIKGNISNIRINYS